MIGDWNSLTEGQLAVVAVVLLVLVIITAIDLDEPWGGINF